MFRQMILQLLFMEILGWYNVMKIDHVVVPIIFLFSFLACTFSLSVRGILFITRHYTVKK